MQSLLLTSVYISALLFGSAAANWQTAFLRQADKDAEMKK